MSQGSSSGSDSSRNKNLKNLVRHDELSSNLLSEGKMEISEVMVHGQNHTS